MTLDLRLFLGIRAKLGLAPESFEEFRENSTFSELSWNSEVFHGYLGNIIKTTS